MEKRLSRDFRSKILQLLEDDVDRELLFKALHDYQQVRSVRTLVAQLKEITVTPDRLILYDEIRPFIVPKHQAEYDRIIPKPPSERTRIIRLVSSPGSEGLGFRFVGGVEFDVGIFVCDVLPKSQAEKKGLKAGDEIIRVNGYSINQATHNEVLAAMKLHKTLMLKVKRVGMYPVKSGALDEISWKLAAAKGGSQPVAAKPKRNVIENDRKVFANLEPGMKLGCGIGTGTDGQPGIFVHKITKGSMAEYLGFKIGDQLIDVNGESFLDVTHSEAVVILKASRQMTITLRTIEYVRNAPPVAAVKPPSFRGGSMGLGIGSRFAREQENKREEEEEIKKEEEERLASVMTSGHWAFTLPKPKEPEPEPEPEEENEEESEEEINESVVILRKSANRFAAITKEEQNREIEKREKEGTYVPTSPSDQDSWWTGSPYTLFTKRQIDGRQLRKIQIPKVGHLDIELEGGFGTPLGGKLVVSEVFSGGAAARSGEMGRGDQIMMVEGKTFIDINRQIAEKFLERCMEDKTEGHGRLRMIIAQAPQKAYEDEILLSFHAKDIQHQRSVKRIQRKRRKTPGS
ncbi:harmonin-like [Amphiura filiformis]|uniref:harmonin-like n=1 Tax=Amphiura filiformis TaxID=82378 RepID=UPI003B20ED80